MTVGEKSDLPETIYHYCSRDSFEKIAESKHLLLSDVRCMNDATEQTWLIEKAKKRLEVLNTGQQRQYIQPIIDNFDWMALDPHALCFSENPDLLSQWRAYGDDGRGYSIGFSTSWLRSQTRRYPRRYVALWPAEYHENRQMELLDHYISGYVTCVEKGGDRKEAGMRLVIAIYGLSAVCKNPGFQEEQEIRLMVMEPHNPASFHEEYRSGISDKFYRNRGACRISYFALPFPEDAITSIYLGPKNAARGDDSDLRAFLSRNGYDLDRIEIKTSAIPYR